MITKKNPEIEIGRNSGLYFAIGLNVMLFLSWQLLEFKTYDKDDVDIGVLKMENVIEEDIPIININTPPPPPPPPPVASIENIKVVENVIEIEETFIASTETNQEERIKDYVPVSVTDVKVEVVEEDVEVPFAVIEDVPVFPGCEGGSKAEIKACFQKKMQEHISKHFRYPQAALDLAIQGRVNVIFVIDAKGFVTGIRSRGPDKILENEAERIMKELPQMQPGKQRGKPVKVPYSVPIVFKMQID
ncbi:energy transducer TonB [Mariniflexile ostreae]|uniref:Energy transducer TonB n=1 Tax=Mariniflexile ostreae TaxID=1520892 RepID=A0ABV5FDT5_9FLAO